VPLNTASKYARPLIWNYVLMDDVIVLAVQNIEASGTVSKPLELEFNALSGSLTVMSKGKLLYGFWRILNNMLTRLQF
jgi:hypothetical protein